VQGPKAAEVLAGLNLPVPKENYALVKTEADIYVANQPRLGSAGFDFFVPVDLLGEWKSRLAEHAPLCDEAAFDRARILATIPRFGQDFTAANLAPEGGIESRAISYSKGCYIGQEIIARIRTYGRVNRILRGLRLEGSATKGDEVFLGEKMVGKLTSVIENPDAALALIQRDATERGTSLRVDTKNGSVTAEVATLPFEKFAG
jgi:folate-binding protein YgfZ